MAFFSGREMQEIDYYANPLEKHFMWAMFHSSLGISLAQTVALLTSPISRVRFIFSDMCALTSYYFGYSLFPAMYHDQQFYFDIKANNQQ